MTIVPWGRIAIGVALLALLGWAAYAIRDSGKDAGLAKGERERAALVADLIHERSQANVCAASLERVTEEAERGIAEAGARAAKGERAAAAAEAAAKDAEARAEMASGALNAAKRLPTCRAQLEMPLCDDIPLL